MHSCRAFPKLEAAPRAVRHDAARFLDGVVETGADELFGGIDAAILVEKSAPINRHTRPQNSLFNDAGLVHGVAPKPRLWRPIVALRFVLSRDLCVSDAVQPMGPDALIIMFEKSIQVFLYLVKIDVI